MSFSKSLFTTAVNCNSGGRSMINPLGSVSQSSLQFSPDTLAVLKEIENEYTHNMAIRNYGDIPDNLERYLNLHNYITLVQSKIKNSDLLLLFQIVNDGLDGAVNSFGLFNANTTLNETVVLLQQRITDILAGKNDHLAFSRNGGNFAMQKYFTLAPVYSYYISIHGVPAEGVGFDPDQIEIMAEQLRQCGINPFH